MYKKILFLLIVSAGILIFSNLSHAEGIKEGNWSMTTVIRMAGMDEEATQAMREMEKMTPEEKAMMQQMMGGMNIEAAAGGMGITTTMTQCLTNENPVPEPDNQEGCEQTHSMKGNTINFEVHCPDSHSSGAITYKNNSMTGTIKSIETQTNQESTIDITGEYVGPCDENSSGIRNISAPQLSERELAIKEKELELKMKELELKEKQLDIESSSEPSTRKSSKKSAIEEVNGAVDTGNNVKSTFNGFRSLLGR